VKKYIIKLLQNELRQYKRAKENNHFSDESIKQYPLRTLEFCAKQRAAIDNAITLIESCIELVKKKL